MKINLNTSIEAEFLIQASNDDVFFNRKSAIQKLSGFNTSYTDSFEKTECTDVWRILSIGRFENLADLKNCMSKLEKRPWFFHLDSYLLLEGECIYSCGKWLV